jgi:DNA-directed RNA polymerase specialized sigma24 family protein
MVKGERAATSESWQSGARSADSFLHEVSDSEHRQDIVARAGMWVHNAAGFLEGWMAEETIAGRLQACLERLYAGDAAAQAELWDLVNERLTVLARKMKRRDFSQVQRWAQTEDIAQNARVRLMRALQEAVPRTARDFYGLANLQIRRELLDTIRQMRGRNQDRDAPVSLLEGQDPENDTFDSHDLLVWQEFHEAIQELPAPDAR